MRMSDYLKATSTHICVYGEPLTGKSTLVTSVCSLGYRVIWISLDSGVEHLLKLPEEQQERVELLQIPDSRMNPVGYPSIYRILSGNPSVICHAHGQHMCPTCMAQQNPPVPHSTMVDLSKCGNETIVVIDHLTQVFASAYSIAVQKAIKSNRQDAAKEVFKTLNEQSLVEFKPGYDQWNHMYSMMQVMMEFIQNCKCHIVAVAHPVATKTEDGETRIVPQSGSDRFSNLTARFFDHTILCKIVNGKFRVYSKAHSDIGQYVVGSRTGIELGQDEWTLARFFEKSAQSSPVDREYGAEAALATLQLEVSKVAEDTELSKLFGARRR